ncbi:copper amine oxidase N-terminal domain-containing protein [Lacrimispora brassicae]
MKKVLATCLAMIMMFMCIPVNASAAAEKVSVIVDGREMDFSDTPAYVDPNGRVQVPASFIASALGAKVECIPGTAARAVFSRQIDGEEIVRATFVVGNDEYYFSVLQYSLENAPKENRQMDTKAVLEQDTVYVPVDYIAEAFEAAVDWNAATKTVTITSKTKVLGGFVVPESYTDFSNMADYEDGTKGVRIDYSLHGGLYTASLEDRKALFLHILSQRLSQESMKKIDSFIKENYDYFSEDLSAVAEDTFLDSNTGQYVRVLRLPTQPLFRVFVYDKGVNPPKV